MSAGRILVVDDDSQIRRVMRATLTARGYEVNDAPSGEAALDRLREQAYDLVLLDMNMPGVDGLETCRAIRAGSEVPIIMLTVRNTERDKVDALDAGADDYITKPFGTPELLARIRAALRRAPLAIDSRQIRFGDIEMDVAARRVVVRGKTVRLTPKEFSLLHFFATHPNQVLSHRELLQAVWGPDYGDESQYLRVFVNQLRKKIESDPARPQYLLTEAWLGYRLQAPG